MWEIRDSSSDRQIFSRRDCLLASAGVAATTAGCTEGEAEDGGNGEMPPATDADTPSETAVASPTEAPTGTPTETETETPPLRSDGGDQEPTNVVWLGSDHFAIRQFQFLREQLDAGMLPATPAYDRLTEEGVKFTRAYASTPICVPSRTTMMTGTYPHNHGLLDNGAHIETNKLPQSNRYYSHAFESADKQPGYFGKWHVGHCASAQAYGFEGWSLPDYGWPYGSVRYDQYLENRGLKAPNVDLSWHLYNDPESITPIDLQERDNQFHDPNVGASVGTFQSGRETHEAYFTADIGTDWIEEQATADDPFFARIVTWGPHQPYWRTEAFADTIDPAAIPTYPNFDFNLSGRPSHHVEAVHNAKRGEPWEMWRAVLAACYEHIAEVDHALNMVLETLDELGIADETLVIYTADHGDLLASNGGGFDKAWLLSEEVARIPLLMRWPDGGIEGGRTVDELVCNIDYAPTMWDAAGMVPPAEMDGRSLLDLARDPDGTDWRDQLLIEHHGHYGEWIFQRALYRDQYKYVAHLGYRDELYNLEKDPYEMDNLLVEDRVPEVRKQMQTALADEMKRFDDDVEDARKLREILREQPVDTNEPVDS